MNESIPPTFGRSPGETAPSVVKVLSNMSVAAAHASNATVHALDATQCEPKRLDAYVGFSRDGEGLPKLVLVSRGSVAATSPRQDLGARRHARGISQRLVRCAAEKRVGLSLGPVPILVKECPFDSVAPKPEVVVADGAFREKRLSRGQSSHLFFPNIRRQGDET